MLRWFEEADSIQTELACNEAVDVLCSHKITLWISKYSIDVNQNMHKNRIQVW